MPFTFDPKPLIGMIHVGALPGTPAHVQPLSALAAQAAHEATLYRQAGLHAVMLENMHDVPYQRGTVGPEIVAAMTRLALAVKTAFDGPVGVQILAGANLEALAVAHAAGLDFVRVEGFAFAHVADEGFIQSSAAHLLRVRRAWGAQAVQVWADIKKKHAAHALTADVTLGETAAAAEFMRAEAVIITGSATGHAPTLAEVREARAHTRLPVLVGSGLTPDNVAGFYAEADGLIVGSYFKHGGDWRNPPDPARIEALLARLT